MEDKKMSHTPSAQKYGQGESHLESTLQKKTAHYQYMQSVINKSKRRFTFDRRREAESSETGSAYD